MESYIILEKPYVISQLSLEIIAYNFENIVFKYIDFNSIEIADIIDFRVTYIEIINLNKILNDMVKKDYSHKINKYNSNCIYKSFCNTSLDSLFYKNTNLSVF
jgi:hypothetical protein